VLPEGPALKKRAQDFDLNNACIEEVEVNFLD
jgi:hypothetical protein